MSTIGGFKVRTGVYAQPERILMYGPQKCGKTTFAASAPGAFFVDLDMGSHHLDVAGRNEEPIETWEEFIKLVHALATERHTFETLVIDQLSRAQELCWKHICRTVGTGPKNRREVDSITEVGGGFGAGFNIAAEKFRELWGLLELAWRKRRMRLILIAHSEVKKYKNPSGPDFERIGPAVQDKAAAVFLQNCDAILYADRNVITKAGMFGGGDKRYHAIGGQSRIVYSEDAPARIAGNRYNLPPQFELDWDKFAEHVANGHTPALLESTIRDRARKVGGDDVLARAEAAIARAGGNPKGLLQVLGKVNKLLDEKVQQQVAAEEAAENSAPVAKEEAASETEATATTDSAAE